MKSKKTHPKYSKKRMALYLVTGILAGLGSGIGIGIVIWQHIPNNVPHPNPPVPPVPPNPPIFDYLTIDNENKNNFIDPSSGIAKNSELSYYFDQHKDKNAIKFAGITTFVPYAFSECDSEVKSRIKALDFDFNLGTLTLSFDAFSGYQNLESIVLSGAGKSISLGDSVFQDCTQLTGFATSGVQVSAIGIYTFSGCKLTEQGIKNIQNMPTDFQKMEKSGQYILYKRTGSNNLYTAGCLAWGDLPTTVFQTVGANAFAGCAGISRVDVGTGITSIGNSAFFGCIGISRINIGGATTIGEKAFAGCVNLASVSGAGMLSGAKAINDDAFSECTSLNVLKFEWDKSSTIGSRAFYHIAEHGEIIMTNIENAKTDFFMKAKNAGMPDNWH